MKKYLLSGCFIFGFLAVSVLSSCRRSEDAKKKVEENIEYHPLVTDSAAIDSINNAGMVEKETVLEVPDIPKEEDVDLEGEGSNEGDLTKEIDPTKI